MSMILAWCDDVGWSLVVACREGSRGAAREGDGEMGGDAAGVASRSRSHACWSSSWSSWALV